MFTKEADDTTTALHDCAASRLSGAFNIHLTPTVMNYCGIHKIPIEIGITDEFITNTTAMRSFAHPIRLLYDKGVPVILGSFRGVFNDSRSNILFKISNECTFTIGELLRFISSSFLYNFRAKQLRDKMWEDAWNSIIPHLKNNGYKGFGKKFYFDSSGTNTFQ